MRGVKLPPIHFGSDYSMERCEELMRENPRGVDRLMDLVEKGRRSTASPKQTSAAETGARCKLCRDVKAALAAQAGRGA